MKKAISLVLVLVLALLAFPAPANASSDGYTTFTTLDELVEIVETQSDTYLELMYEGTDPLVIDRDLTIPKTLSIHCENTSVTVAEGAKLTIDRYGTIQIDYLTVLGELENNGNLFVYTGLTVRGTMVNNSSYFTIDGPLEIEGSLINTSELTIPIDKDLPGIDQITHDGGCLEYEGQCGTNLALLQQYLDMAAADTRESVCYQIYCRDYSTPDAALILDADLIIPANTTLTWDTVQVTLPAGRTLTVYGFLEDDLAYNDGRLMPGRDEGFVSVPFLVEGTLNIALDAILQINDSIQVTGNVINDGTIFVSYTWASWLDNVMISGELNMTAGTYSGAGTIQVVQMAGKEELESYLPGLDLSIFDIELKKTRWYLTPKVPSEEETHEYDYGDVNHDGDIKISDAILVMKYRAGNLSEGDTFCERCANVKGEGPINIQSAILIMKKRANKNMLFPVEMQ